MGTYIMVLDARTDITSLSAIREISVLQSRKYKTMDNKIKAFKKLLTKLNLKWHEESGDVLMDNNIVIANVMFLD